MWLVIIYDGMDRVIEEFMYFQDAVEYYIEESKTFKCALCRVIDMNDKEE